MGTPRPRLIAPNQLTPDGEFSERQFKRKFGVTPRTYLARTRVVAACQLLSSTDLRIAEVAQRTGFCDQSHFTHAFVKHRRITPSAYRTRYQR